MGKRKTGRRALDAQPQLISDSGKYNLRFPVSNRAWYIVISGIVLVAAAVVAVNYFLDGRSGMQTEVALESSLLLSRPPSTLEVTRPVNRLPETQLGSAVTSDGITIQQSFLTCPKGKMIIDHFPIGYAQIAAAADSRVGEFKENYFVDGEPWYQGFETGHVLTTFNCFTFAIAPFVGLTPNDRLEAAVTPGLGNPLELALASYFKSVATFDLNSSFQSDQFEKNEMLLDGDVFCLITKQYGEVTYVHAGRVKKVESKDRLLSKFGRQGPILLTDWKYIFRYYQGTEIRVFRFDPNTRRSSSP